MNNISFILPNGVYAYPLILVVLYLDEPYIFMACAKRIPGRKAGLKVESTV